MKSFALALLFSSASAIKLNYDYYDSLGSSYMPDGLEEDFTGYA